MRKSKSYRPRVKVDHVRQVAVTGATNGENLMTNIRQAKGIADSNARWQRSGTGQKSETQSHSLEERNVKPEERLAKPIRHKHASNDEGSPANASDTSVTDSAE
jgi:hypothetical protein